VNRQEDRPRRERRRWSSPTVALGWDNVCDQRRSHASVRTSGSSRSSASWSSSVCASAAGSQPADGCGEVLHALPPLSRRGGREPAGVTETVTGVYRTEGRTLHKFPGLAGECRDSMSFNGSGVVTYSKSRPSRSDVVWAADS